MTTKNMENQFAERIQGVEPSFIALFF